MVEFNRVIMQRELRNLTIEDVIKIRERMADKTTEYPFDVHIRDIRPEYKWGYKSETYSVTLETAIYSMYSNAADFVELAQDKIKSMNDVIEDFINEIKAAQK
jgi:hypothetical protein